MSGEVPITVAPEGGDRFRIEVRGHVLHVDQSREDGGEDTAPEPTELVVAGVASLVALHVRRYLHRHGLGTGGMSVTARYELADRRVRVGTIRIEVTPPHRLPPEHRASLLFVAARCTGHDAVSGLIPVSVTLAGPAPAPGAGAVRGVHP